MRYPSVGNRYRLLVSGGVLLTLLATAIWLFWKDRLPEPLATHWGSGQQPDGNMSFWVIFGITVGGMAISLLALVLLGRPKNGPQQAMVGLTTYLMMGFLLGATITTVSANIDAADWFDAASIDLLDFVVLISTGVGAGAVGVFLGGGWSQMTLGQDAGTRPTVALGPTESATWTGSAASWVLVAGSAVVLAAAIVAGVTFSPAVGALLLLAFALIVWFSAVRVTVTSQKVSIGLGWWSWPQVRVPLTDIEAADFLQVEPVAFGGWGYRITPGVRGFIARRGEGIRLVRSGKADIVVTVDDAERGAGLVNDFIARRSTTEDAD